MLKVLVPVDGSPNALRAVRHAIDEYRRHHELELHLLNVQPRFSRHISRFVGRQDLQAWHRERADAALAPARGCSSRRKCRINCTRRSASGHARSVVRPNGSGFITS